MAEAKDIIKIEHLRRDFKVGDEVVHALKGVSFTIKEGEFVTIMGTSGSGKSTLLNIIGCLDSPTDGEYYLDGISVKKMNKNQRAEMRNKKIGFVFQSYNLLPKTTSIENVELPLMYNPDISSKERREKAVAALEAVGLKERLMHKSNQLSGGQQQRVAIARALVNDPVIILADEATGNLDTRTSYDILVLFQNLYKKGRTIVFVTHNPELAKFSSRNIVLRDGRIIQDEYNQHVASAKETLDNLPPDDQN
ncbi:MAG: ABC transporter ATP-binding protein [Bacteroidales bacterium]|nr:ABC transporter ATP-binding protein [Bacteroidales bacterium]